MRVPFALFVLVATIACTQEDTQEGNKRFVRSPQPTNISAMHDSIENLRHRLLETLKDQLSNSDKEMLKEYNKHPHPLNLTHVNKEGDSIDEINEKRKTPRDLYETDMLLTQRQLEEITKANNNQPTRGRRQAYIGRDFPYTLWNNKLVSYYFDPSLSEKAIGAIQRAVIFWQTHTCINFQENSRAADRIRFFPGDGCYSSLGQIGGEQGISIGSGCELVGTVTHELGHALGFFHEQSRHDRDMYIVVNQNNIKKDWIDQFNKESTSTNDNFGFPYDYTSIMQYDGQSASSNGGETMIAKDSNYQQAMGSQIASFYDHFMMNVLYDCIGKCPKPLDCRNGGYQHPRDCSKCLCPRGYGGDVCTSRPQGCGEMLSATAQTQTFTSEILYIGETRYDFSECYYVVMAPKGTKIEVQLTGLTSTSCTLGCIYGGVEFKAHPDARRGGYRYCCPENVNAFMRSSNHMLPIILFSREGQTGFKITYRIANGPGEPGPAPNAPYPNPPYPNVRPQPNPTGTRPRTSQPMCVDKSHCANTAGSACGSPAFRQICPKRCRLC